jgi:hypothetical protein
VAYGLVGGGGRGGGGLGLGPVLVWGRSGATALGSWGGRGASFTVPGMGGMGEEKGC